MRNDYGNKPRKKLAGGKRVGKQFGGGLNRPLGGVLSRPVANPMGVAAPGRRFGMKHGSKSKSKK